MRIPVLNSELSTGFKKVAKYIGRHWPNGKLSLTESMNHTASLFGYNNYYELKKVAQSNIQENLNFEMSKIRSSVLVKALYYYQINPLDMIKLLYKVPFHELTFFKHTDEHKNNQYLNEMSKKGIYLFRDELQEFMAYKKPEIFVGHYINRIIPPYSYAVNKDGKIFISSYYESIFNTLGEITPDILSGIDSSLTVKGFIDQCIKPLIWQPIKKVISQDDGNFISIRTPDHIMLYKIFDTETKQALGYSLFHTDFNSYYPYVFQTVNALIEAITLIYKDKPITDELDQCIALPNTFNKNYINRIPKNDNSTYKVNSQTVSLTGCSYFAHNQQYFIHAIPYQSYDVEKTLLSLINNKANEEIQNIFNDYPIMNNAISSDFLNEHIQIKASLDYLNLKYNDSMKIHKDRLRSLLSYYFQPDYFLYSNLIDAETNDYDKDELIKNRSRYFNDGLVILSAFPELSCISDTESLGYHYHEFLNFDRYYSVYSHIDYEFIYYLISYAFNTHIRLNQKEHIYLGKIYVDVFDSLSDEGNLIAWDQLNHSIMNTVNMLKHYTEQDKRINQFIAHEKLLNNKEERYVTQGVLLPSVGLNQSPHDFVKSICTKGKKHNLHIKTFKN